MQRVEGFVQQGGTVVKTTGIPGVPDVQTSYPGATVTVYLTGTMTLATIYSDNSSTPLSNPFTANSSGFWFFYAANGRYDVAFSGGGLPAPWTLGDILLQDGAGSTSVTSVTGGAGVTASPTTGAVTVSNAWGAPPSGSQTQQLQIQPNTGNNTTYHWSGKTPSLASDYVKFSSSGLFVAPPENISPSLRTMTLAPVPLGINSTDTAHWVGIYNNSGVFQEAVLINGGSAVSGGATGTITVASIAGTYAAGSYQIGSVTAGILEAIWASASSGVQIRLADGVSVLRAAVTIPRATSNNVSIVGGGGWTTVIRRGSNYTSGDLFLFDETTNNGAAFSLQGMRIEAGTNESGSYMAVSSGAAVHLKNAGAVDLRDLWITNGYDGIDVESSNTWTVDNCYFIQESPYVASFASHAGLSLHGTGINTAVVSNSKFLAQNPAAGANLLTAGLLIKASDGVQVVNSAFSRVVIAGGNGTNIDDIYLDNIVIDTTGGTVPSFQTAGTNTPNVFTNIRLVNSHINPGPNATDAIGIGGDVDQIQIANNNIQLAPGNGIVLSGENSYEGGARKDVRIQGNVISDNNTSNTANTHGILLQNGAAGFLITGNTINNRTTGGHQVYGVGAGNVSNGIISGNNLTGNATGPILFAGSVSGVAVGPNVGVDDPADATATTGAATMNRLRGTITSESLTTAAGSTYTLTLTNSSITATTVIAANAFLGTSTQGTPQVVSVTPGSGSATVVVKNIHATQAFNGTIKIQIQGVTAF